MDSIHEAVFYTLTRIFTMKKNETEEYHGTRIILLGTDSLSVLI